MCAIDGEQLPVEAGLAGVAPSVAWPLEPSLRRPRMLLLGGQGPLKKDGKAGSRTFLPLKKPLETWMTCVSKPLGPMNSQGGGKGGVTARPTCST